MFVWCWFCLISSDGALACIVHRAWATRICVYNKLYASSASQAEVQMAVQSASKLPPLCLSLKKPETLKSRALLEGHFHPQVCLESVVLQWVFQLLTSLGGFCKLYINLSIWLCNCVKIHSNLDASKPFGRRFRFFV